ncbi:hypothetical protein [Myxococcus xanthus]|uniref:hypothetical protein n=1 Tax=Myxococcus xanthus TaxID=34 RepID=UPI00148C6D09|nr:hypothetical protein [Myxococcus xanthus]NOJ88867.1 hypothetical protein [Myxococcus xanthus]
MRDISPPENGGPERVAARLVHGAIHSRNAAPTEPRGIHAERIGDAARLARFDGVSPVSALMGALSESSRPAFAATSWADDAPAMDTGTRAIPFGEVQPRTAMPAWGWGPMGRWHAAA